MDPRTERRWNRRERAGTVVVVPGPILPWNEVFNRMEIEHLTRVDTIEALMTQKNIAMSPEDVQRTTWPQWLQQIVEGGGLEAVQEPPWFRRYVAWMEGTKVIEERFIEYLREN